MILPTKHIPSENSLLGVGAMLLQYLSRPRTVTSLWEEAKQAPNIGTFERFTLALDFLYTIGSIELDKGLLKRIQS